MQELEHLGKQSQEAVTLIDKIPWEGGAHVKVTLECTEFTSHCPVTKQPDFGQLVIQYVPTDCLIETKSLKLYLWQFRDEAEFNEKLVDHICSDLFEQLQPAWLLVRGVFNKRGGIGVTCEATLGELL